ncbi:MAG: M15 family metallopeptidase [Eubacteriales bacterium]|nr:M15 family metallopeptidase [Eubacteriales bacterium]
MKRKFLPLLAALLVLAAAAPALAEVMNYIPAFADRYNAYAMANPYKTYGDILTAVNLKLDEENYSNIYTTNEPESLTVLVSKHYAIAKDYKPKQLTSVNRQYAQSGVRLRKDCYEAFLMMAKDMEQEGLTLYIKSGYRTNRKRGGINSLWYAWPGHSEHQTGLAFDLRKKNVSYQYLSEYRYETTREYAWLCENAYRYGFILSYPAGKSDITGFGFEPWHWRYIGVDIATDMREKGFVTYHEYWANYMIQNTDDYSELQPQKDLTLVYAKGV